MGWFWGSNNEDPVNKLDPDLREYLENEAPKKYVPATQSSPVAEEKVLPSKSASPDIDASPAAPAVPSLFPDGRYADLWKTYKPPAPGDIETEASEDPSMQAKSKQRHAMVKRAAMENCSIENEIYHICLKSPTLIERVTACQDKNKVFTRCYATQSKFLNALGYASSSRWDDDREERIQLHADKLYHEMLDYEKQVEEAREAGQEPPPLKSLFNPQAAPVQRDSVGPAELEIPGGQPIPDGFKPSKSLDRLTPHERELEIRAYLQELEEQREYVKSMAPVIRAHEEGKDKRREKLVSWFGETVGTWMTR
ncbi:hypothetical protein BDW74DRAFT_16837 [Aspergillus multicolor]|uniref:uncharacterized protein n=1 Tax=Aspergillus multicolor TaxID=41759 RepID=UPI003CCDE265